MLNISQNYSKPNCTQEIILQHSWTKNVHTTKCYQYNRMSTVVWITSDLVFITKTVTKTSP